MLAAPIRADVGCGIYWGGCCPLRDHRARPSGRARSQTSQTSGETRGLSGWLEAALRREGEELGVGTSDGSAAWRGFTFPPSRGCGKSAPPCFGQGRCPLHGPISGFMPTWLLPRETTAGYLVHPTQCMRFNARPRSPPLPVDGRGTEQGLLLCQGSGLPCGRCGGSPEARLRGRVCGQPVPANLALLVSALPAPRAPAHPPPVFLSVHQAVLTASPRAEATRPPSFRVPPGPDGRAAEEDPRLMP